MEEITYLDHVRLLAIDHPALPVPVQVGLERDGYLELKPSGSPNKPYTVCAERPGWRRQRQARTGTGDMIDFFDTQYSVASERNKEAVGERAKTTIGSVTVDKAIGTHFAEGPVHAAGMLRNDVHKPCPQGCRTN